MQTVQFTAIQRKIIFFLALATASWMSPAVALLIGIIFAQFVDHPFAKQNHSLTNNLLKYSVVGLGFGMNLYSSIAAGRSGILLTVGSIVVVLVAGYFLGKWFRLDRKISFLIAAGTAICGGSAIAALSPIIRVGEKQLSVALGTIFILNAIALVIFPMLGHYFNLTQSQFGVWCAIAIHDTSSVVGAASKYGAESLAVATTVKLARSLWIIPVAFFTAMQHKGEGKQPIYIPYFIIAFILAMLANTYLPFVQQLAPYFRTLANLGLTITLFLIGTGLSFHSLRAIGCKPFIQGVILWVLIASLSLTVIMLT